MLQYSIHAGCGYRAKRSQMPGCHCRQEEHIEAGLARLPSQSMNALDAVPGSMKNPAAHKAVKHARLFAGSCSGAGNSDDKYTASSHVS